MATDGLKTVSAATGDEAAAGAQQRRDPLAIQPDQGQQQQRQPSLKRPGTGGTDRGQARLGLQAKLLRPNR